MAAPEHSELFQNISEYSMSSENILDLIEVYEVSKLFPVPGW